MPQSPKARARKDRAPKPQPTAQQRRNRWVGMGVAGVFFGMIGAAYASVPLYQAFCQATGYDGTVSRASKAPDKVLADQITMHFDVNVRDLPWDFTAEQVTNHSDKPVVGRAVFNVVPEQAGAYLHKLSCFCFSDQTIAAHATVEMPVLYFVDPKYATDFETKNQKDVTLSYTFYPAVDAKPVAAAGAAAN
jgi:cytochrome c oxidase assembly protein subunit 11